MKLYATVTSERATKGQGGKYLDIEIFTTRPDEPTHRIEVREKPGEITLTTFRKHFGKWYNSSMDTVHINDATKGEKQKGETGNVCAPCVDPYAREPHTCRK